MKNRKNIKIAILIVLLLVVLYFFVSCAKSCLPVKPKQLDLNYFVASDNSFKFLNIGWSEKIDKIVDPDNEKKEYWLYPDKNNEKNTTSGTKKLEYRKIDRLKFQLDSKIADTQVEFYGAYADRVTAFIFTFSSKDNMQQWFEKQVDDMSNVINKPKDEDLTQSNGDRNVKWVGEESYIQMQLLNSKNIAEIRISKNVINQLTPEQIQEDIEHQKLVDKLQGRNKS